MSSRSPERGARGRPARSAPTTEVRTARSPRSMRVIAASLVVAVTLGILWLSLDVLLLFFAAVLCAVFFRGLGELVRRVLPLSEGWALAVGEIALLVVIVLATVLFSARLTVQVTRLTEEIPRALDRLQEEVGREPAGRWVLERLPAPSDLLQKHRSLMSATTSALFGTLGLAASSLVVVFLGLYLAAAPRTYRGAALRLVPPKRRARAAEVFDELGTTLRWWLAGKLLSMTLIGVATFAGLVGLGIPAPGALALLAAILTFVPNFGPVVSAVPAVLLGLLSSPMTAVWVAVFYLGVQLFESYVVTPVIQERAVSLPPGVTIAAQIFLGVAAGILGVALATPVVAVAVVLTKRLYVEDYLGDAAA